MENSTRKPLVTYESVTAVADALASQAQRPTVRAVIAALGGGSPNSVLPHLNAWKGSRPSVKAHDIVLDPRVSAIVAEQIRSAVFDATASIEARAADSVTDAEAVAEAGRAAERRIEELIEEVASVGAENHRLAGRLETLAHEYEQSKRDCLTMAATVRETADVAVTKAHELAARERQAAEFALQSLAKAELRLEGLPALESNVARLSNLVDQERGVRAVAECKAAVAIAERQAAQQRADELRSSMDHARAEAAAEIERLRVQVDGLQDRFAEIVLRASPEPQPAARP